jgi:hypothetical protein
VRKRLLNERFMCAIRCVFGFEWITVPPPAVQVQTAKAFSSVRTGAIRDAACACHVGIIAQRSVL